MEACKLGFQFDERVIGARDIARPACSRAVFLGGGGHGGDHLGMLAHAKIVVGAPDYDLARPLRAVAEGIRECPGVSFDVGEYPVTALRFQFGDRIVEEAQIGHDDVPCSRPANSSWWTTFILVEGKLRSAHRRREW